MTTSPTGSPVVRPPNDRLHGWKEIAAYLGRGVRTVQRWEKVFGMPVHRIGTGRGEIVYGLKDELDTWLAASEQAGTLGDDVAGNPASGPLAGGPGDLAAAAAVSKNEAEGPVTDVRRRPSRRTGLAAIAFIVLVAIAGFVVWSSRVVAQPSTAKVDGDTLRVYDADQHLLWAHRFDFPLPELTGTSFLGNGRNLLIDDIDADGSREVVVFAADAHQSAPVRLYCFNAAGRVIWTRMPNRSVRFGSRTFPPPWLGHRLFVTGAGRNRTLWAAWIHLETGFFPCLLERLSAQSGQPQSEYWSAGYVNFVGLSEVQGRPSILVGANNNDHQAASLAVFDADRVTGSALAETEDKTCRDCPPGGPRAFLVFPRLEIGALTERIPTVFDVRRQGTGELSVWVVQAGDAAVSYQLASNLQPISAEIGAEYRAEHRALQEKGRLNHPFGPQDHLQLWPVLIAQPNRFVPVTGGVTY
jgi:hypothetical protein